MKKAITSIVISGALTLGIGSTFFATNVYATPATAILYPPAQLQCVHGVGCTGYNPEYFYLYGQTKVPTGTYVYRSPALAAPSLSHPHSIVRPQYTYVMGSQQLTLAAAYNITVYLPHSAWQNPGYSPKHVEMWSCFGDRKQCPYTNVPFLKN